MVYLLAQFGGGISSMLNTLVNLQFFQLLFPFLLGLTIVYVLLKYSIGDKINNAATGLISIIFGFFIMLYFAWNPMLYQILVSMSGTVLMVISGILFLIIVMALFGLKFDEITDTTAKKIVLIAIILYILFVAVSGSLPGLSIPLWIGTSDLWTLIFFAVIIGIVLYYLSKDSGGSSDSNNNGSMKKK